MSREWKPGDVAVVTWDDASSAVRRSGGSDVRKLVGVRTASGWAIQHALSHVRDEAVSEARPLVVIDPEDREQVKAALAAWFGSRKSTVTDDEVTRGQAAFRSLITPPKPPEPRGLGAVVEDVDGRRWIYAPSGLHMDNWQGIDSRRDYSGIAAVKVLSEGMTP